MLLNSWVRQKGCQGQFFFFYEGRKMLLNLHYWLCLWSKRNLSSYETVLFIQEEYLPWMGKVINDS